jgi:CHAT domain-containing protein
VALANVAETYQSQGAMHRRLVSMCLSVVLALCWPAPVSAEQDEAAMRDAAFEGAQWIMFTAASRAVAGVGARLAAGDDDLGTLIREGQDLEAEAAAHRAAALEVLKAGGDPSAEEAALRAVLTRSEAVQAEIVARFPAYAEFAVPRPLSVGEVRALLAPGEALVLILSGTTGTYVWAISPTQTGWTRSDMPEAELSDAVRTLRASLDPTGPARAAVALEAPAPGVGRSFDRGLAHKLYDRLLGPLAPVLATADVVQVVAQGPLASLPLTVLVTDPPQGADDDPAALADTAWLVRRHALVTLPAVSSLASLRRSAPRSQGGGVRFVGIGAPVLDGPGGASVAQASRGAALVSGAYGDPAVLRRLPALPGTLREVQAIGALFPPGERLILTGAEATETRLRGSDLSGARMIHFATHGLVSGDVPGLTEAALVLTPPDVATAMDDGLLTASEAARLTLDADWVILSACNTAAGDSLGGESLSGLARAFFFAGARALLVSHWPVRDDAAALLVTRTMAALQDDPAIGRAEALRVATITLVDGDAGMAHPSAWAPFVIVGDGGPLQ